MLAKKESRSGSCLEVWASKRVQEDGQSRDVDVSQAHLQTDTKPPLYIERKSTGKRQVQRYMWLPMLTAD